MIIFWQFTISVNVWFATSKTDLISTIIGFAYALLHELPEIGCAAEGHQCPHFPSWNEFPKDAVKNYAKADITVFWPCLILLDFFFKLLQSILSKVVAIIRFINRQKVNNDNKKKTLIEFTELKNIPKPNTFLNNYASIKNKTEK